MAIPIWKDAQATYIGGGKSNYTLSVDGNEIFKGRAVTAPGKLAATVKLNDIAKSYLSSRIAYESGTTIYQQPLYKRTFEVSPTPSSGLKKSVIYNDWSYEEMEISSNSQSLSKPLSKIVDPRQILFATMAKVGDGEAGEVCIDYCDNNMCHRPLRAIPTPCVTFAYPLNGVNEGVDVGIYDEEDDICTRYKVKKTNADYCLYYLNAYGGYDHLLINGNAMRTDSIARSQITRSVGKQTLSVETQRKWRLYTDYLTDEQWALTHHLLGSPHVLLHDFNKDEIIPINITNNVAEFKTYRNQHNKCSYLTLDVEEENKRNRM